MKKLGTAIYDVLDIGGYSATPTLTWTTPRIIAKETTYRRILFLDLDLKPVCGDDIPFGLSQRQYGIIAMYIGWVIEQQSWRNTAGELAKFQADVSLATRFAYTRNGPRPDPKSGAHMVLSNVRLDLLSIYQIYMALREGFVKDGCVPGERLRFRQDSSLFEHDEVAVFLENPVQAMRDHVYAARGDDNVLEVHVDAFLDVAPLHTGAQRILGCAGSTSSMVEVKNPPLPPHRGNSRGDYNAYFPILRSSRDDDGHQHVAVYAGMERKSHTVDAFGTRDNFVGAFELFSALSAEHSPKLWMEWDAESSRRLAVLAHLGSSIAKTIEKAKQDHAIIGVVEKMSAPPTDATAVDCARVSQVVGLGKKLVHLPAHSEYTPFQNIIPGFVRRVATSEEHYARFLPSDVIDVARALFKAIELDLVVKLRASMPEKRPNHCQTAWPSIFGRTLGSTRPSAFELRLTLSRNVFLPSNITSALSLNIRTRAVASSV